MLAEERYRRPRGGRRARRDAAPQNDPIAMALAAQIAICALLLLLALLARQVNKHGYSEIKTQYEIMAADPAQNAAFLTFFEQDGGLSEILTKIKQWLKLPQPGQPDESSETAQPPAQSEAAPAFNYDYISTQSLSAGGAGGLNPVAEDMALAKLSVPEGNSVAPVDFTGRIQPPVTGLITSEFAYRYHPITGQADFHNGMDIAAEAGRAILAALPGFVEEIGWSDIYGNFIRIRHTEKLSTYYAHCSEIIAAQGVNVRRGERVAIVGQTGVATGPHLHFSAIVDGEFVDPYWLLKDNITLVE